ncbi:MFS transporter [Acidianus manzaensis]|uniref:MFS transporter n=1 Tax=Acidianus manzaensis TaxID=282676 RepID=UPI001C9CE234|nr:MFS transporter [Acidianus manzaensis]
MVSIATSWVTIPKILESLLLAWAPLWLIIGIIFSGPLSDKLGRKKMFYVTMSLYAVGAVGIVFSYTYYLVLFFLAMLLFAAGGEMNTILVLNHEIMPSKHRSKTMFFEINFINFGGLLLAAVALLTVYSSVTFQRVMIGVTALIILGLLAYVRSRIPESIRWLAKKGELEKAESEMNKLVKDVEIKDDPPIEKVILPSIPLTFIVLVLLAAANTIGYGLMTYVLGPYFFPSLIAMILLVANLSEFLTGLGISPFADKLSRKLLILISFAGTVFSTFLIYLLIPYWTKDLILFWILLVVLNVFTGITYLTTDTMKGEVWPTIKRGTYTALVRFVAIGSYIPTIFLTASFTIYEYTMFNIFIWSLGLIAGIVWYLKGVETGKGRDLSEFSD